MSPSLEKLREAASRLRGLVRGEVVPIPGGCQMLSLGDQCTCGLCDVDRLARAALSVPAPQWPTSQPEDATETLADALGDLYMLDGCGSFSDDEAIERAQRVVNAAVREGRVRSVPAPEEPSAKIQAALSVDGVNEDDAPSHFGNAEAHAWVCGYEAGQNSICDVLRGDQS